MTSSANLSSVRPPPSFPLALGITLAMSLVYTAIDTIQFQEPLQSLLSFVPALISLSVLTATGLSRTDLNLRIAPISRAGLFTLAGVTILLLPILGSSTHWVGWDWLPALVYAPDQGLPKSFIFVHHCCRDWNVYFTGIRRRPFYSTQSSLSAFTFGHFNLSLRLCLF